MPHGKRCDYDASGPALIKSVEGERTVARNTWWDSGKKLPPVGKVFRRKADSGL